MTHPALLHPATVITAHGKCLVADPQGVELLASGDRAHLALVLRGRIQPAQSLLHVGNDASDLFSLNNGYGIFVSTGLSPGYFELLVVFL